MGSIMIIDFFFLFWYISNDWNVITGRGRGRGSYLTDAPRGRFGARSYGRGGGYEGGDRDYNRPRGNGFYRPAPRQDRGYSGHQVSRSGQNLSQ